MLATVIVTTRSAALAVPSRAATVRLCAMSPPLKVDGAADPTRLSAHVAIANHRSSAMLPPRPPLAPPPASVGTRSPSAAAPSANATLVDRLGGSSTPASGGASPAGGRAAEPDPAAGWDTPVDDSSKRIKMDRSQKYPAVPEGPRSDRRGQGRSSFGGRRDRGDPRRDRSARRAGNE